MDRENPEVILARIQEEQQKAVRGRLKIFFGYAAGVGKTYAMLEAARAARQAGVDVVCGYVEPHRRPETEALLDGLEQLPLSLAAQPRYQGQAQPGGKVIVLGTRQRRRSGSDHRPP